MLKPKNIFFHFSFKFFDKYLPKHRPIYIWLDVFDLKKGGFKHLGDNF